eukprot:COSAG05_NODE_296_length_11959_cov_17.897639_11_plen_459_part_00
MEQQVAVARTFGGRQFRSACALLLLAAHTGSAGGPRNLQEQQQPSCPCKTCIDGLRGLPATAELPGSTLQQICETTRGLDCTCYTCPCATCVRTLKLPVQTCLDMQMNCSCLDTGPQPQPEPEPEPPQPEPEPRTPSPPELEPAPPSEPMTVVLSRDQLSSFCNCECGYWLDGAGAGVPNRCQSCCSHPPRPQQQVGAVPEPGSRARVPAVNCTGAWGSWGACSVLCGGGSQARTYRIIAAAANGGAACTPPNGTEQQRSCGELTCQTPAPREQPPPHSSSGPEPEPHLELLEKLGSGLMPEPEPEPAVGVSDVWNAGEQYYYDDSSYTDEDGGEMATAIVLVLGVVAALTCLARCVNSSGRAGIGGSGSGPDTGYARVQLEDKYNATSSEEEEDDDESTIIGIQRSMAEGAHSDAMKLRELFAEDLGSTTEREELSLWVCIQCSAVPSPVCACTIRE